MAKDKLTCNEIEKELMNFVQANTSEIVVPNYYIGTWECDLLKISKAGQLTEYEIKPSRADFKKDAEKCRSYYPGGRLFESNLTTISKHDIIFQGKRCNRFYFVVPEGLVTPEEVPAGMGLIYAKKYSVEIWKGLYSTEVKYKDTIRFSIVKVSKLFKKKAVMSKCMSI